MPASTHLLTTEQGRQRLVTLALNLTRNTAFFPDEWEQQLLEQFVQGKLTLDEMEASLDAQPQKQVA